MCGIAGIVDFEGGDAVDRQSRVREMARIIAHRGPDSDGFYSDTHASLGHRRLAIIDLESGDQPMSTPDGRFHIVFNGEIYNFREVREQLEKKGHQFRTNSDTEVLLLGYVEWQGDLVERINGMFAFAIWDARDRRLFLARDRFGKKPLYLCRIGKKVIFASELKSVLASGLVEAKIDNRAVMDYLSFGFIPVPRTIFSAVSKMPSAHVRLEDATGSTETPYWTLRFGNPVTRSPRQIVEEFADLLDEAVRCRLISDVPLGAFLSGGLDSSLVVASMARIADEPVKTHTIGTNDHDTDESGIARETARFLGTDHHEFTVEPNAVDTLQRIAWHMDEPFADPSVLPTWYVCQMTRQSVTVALSGDGGDEGFGGYTFRYVPHRAEASIRRFIPAAMRSLAFGPLSSIWPRHAGLPRPLRLKSILGNLAVSDAEAFYRDLLILNEKDLLSTVKRDFVAQLCGYDGFETVSRFYSEDQDADALSRSQYADIKFYMTDDVLAKVDRISMAHSLEVRAPLLDYRVLEFAASLHPGERMSFRKGKLPLRALAEKRLPTSILEQPKRGFSIPVQAWLRSELKDFGGDVIFRNSGFLQEVLDRKSMRQHWDDHQSGRRDNSAFLWAAMMFGLWESEYASMMSSGSGRT